MDTQWPRFEVFEQERPDQPHRNAGSVHAPDAEMALQNARDVFARRPATVSLWVAPASAVTSATAEELRQRAAGSVLGPTEEAAPAQTYLVFHKLSQRQAETFVTYAAAVQARSPGEALALAASAQASDEVFVWWVVPESAVSRSDPAEAASMFAPAHDKRHRMPNYYQVHRLMREARAAGEPAAAGSAEANS